MNFFPCFSYLILSQQLTKNKFKKWQVSSSITEHLTQCVSVCVCGFKVKPGQSTEKWALGEQS